MNALRGSLRAAARTARIITRAATHVASTIKDSITSYDYARIPEDAWVFVSAQSWGTIFRFLGLCLILYSPLLVAPALYGVGATGSGAGAGGSGVHPGTTAALLHAAIGPLQTGILFTVLRTALMGGYGLAAAAWGVRLAAGMQFLAPVVAREVRTRFFRGAKEKKKLR